MSSDLENWFGGIMAYAQDNYETDGWDIFVECMSLSDFTDDYKRGYFTDGISAFQYYERDCRDRSIYRADVMLEAF